MGITALDLVGEICKKLASYLGKEEILPVISCQSNQTWVGASVIGFSVMDCLVVQLDVQ